MKFWKISLILSLGIITLGKKHQLPKFPYFHNIQNIASRSSSSGNNEISENLLDLANDESKQFLCELHSNSYYPEDELPSDANFVDNDNFALSNNLDLDELNEKNKQHLSLLESEMQTKEEKRGGTVSGCDCQIKENFQSGESEKVSRRCWRGSRCKPVEYKVRVLTYRTLANEKDHTVLLPDSLRTEWKFKTVTVAAGCFCSF